MRFSTARGLPVVDEDSFEQLGVLSGIFIHPDTGKVEGFFVRTPGFFRSEDLFLSSLDILRWGLRVSVRSPDVLSVLEDRVRLQSLQEERRTLLGQRVVTDTGRAMGVCADVQFDTDHFMVEWIWPKRLWIWGVPLPLSQIQEVRRDAIVVRDPGVPAPEKTESAKAPMLNPLETA